MKFNAFDQVSPAFVDMRKLLFPISLAFWCKLGLVSLLAGGSGGGGSGNYGRGRDEGGLPEGFLDGGLQGVRDALGVWYYLLLPIIALVILLGLVLTYVTSVFTFIFLEALIVRKVEIRKAWRRHRPLGFSYFLFRVALGFTVLAILALAALPFVVPILRSGWSAYVASFSVASLAWIVPLAIVLVLLLIAVALFASLVYHFSTVHMYLTGQPARASIRATFARMREEKLAVFVYMLVLFLLGIATGLVALIVGLVLLVPFALVALPFGLLFWALVSAYGWTALIITALVIVALAAVLAFIYAVAVVLLPVSTFLRYFSIRNYRALMR